MMNVRSSAETDIVALQKILRETGIFPAEMLPALMQAYLDDPPSQDIWLTCARDGEAVGFCYARPEPLTQGTWNMLAIAVRPHQQGRGAGSALVTKLEALLGERGGRVLIADTSGTEDYSRTRAFYRKAGYRQEAVIHDFWEEGADKITFWKLLKRG